MKKNLILTGMMGVGKSTIGKALADKLSMRFIDIDKDIEKKENLNINDIFKNKGEFYFRGLEEKTTKIVLEKFGAVIALGGGAFINNEIRKLVLKTSVSFWLDLEPKEIEARVKNSKKRPLLNNNNLSETLKKIYFERKNIYDLANFRIDCNKIKQEKIVDKIINLYADFRN